MERWPHQIRAFDETTSLIDAGEQAVCVTSPTGGGKSLIISDLVFDALEKRKKVSIYTDRKLLLEQFTTVLEKNRIDFGIRASGYNPALLRDVQLSSIMTEKSRVLDSEKWDLHKATLVVVDEAHKQKADVACKLFDMHKEHGAAIVGFTATPLDIGHVYSKLVVAGVNSELRACGAHVPCTTYGPDEPDTRKLKRTKTGEYKEGEVRKAIMTPTIFGRVYDNWRKLNPEAKPTILFAPGVKESIWFAEQFEEKGIRAAHIDGDDIYLDGQSVPSTPEGRQQIIEGTRDGSIQVVCNRFVMREGIDMPWLAHCIFATVFGSLTSYLQAGGRLLRAYPGLEQVILQDHGGNWHRHGSLNSDREWDLGLSAYVAAQVREDRLREHKDPQPICCPKCHGIRLKGPVCPHCGHEHSKNSRMVVQLDGRMKMMEGDVVRPRTIREFDNTQELWRQMVYRMKRCGRTFAQAEGLFFYENHYWPPRTLGLMPTNDTDWYRHVQDVPMNTLTPDPKWQAQHAGASDGARAN